MFLSITAWLTNLFPLWVVLASGLALVHPPIFTWFRGPLITIGLGIIMLGMGLTLRWEDFRGVMERPRWVCLGVVLQFTVMPLLGWSLGYLFDLPLPFAVGLILVSACPGGTASNVITYLARANVALSVTMTAVSTSLAVIFTPLITTFLVGERVDVSAWGLFLSTVQVVVLPITLGVLLNRYAHRFTMKILPAAPLVAVIAITLIVASIIGAGRADILSAAPSLAAAVASLHGLGFLLGRLLSKFITGKVEVSRTISIEVGMQNSGLGVVLAKQNFTDPLVAIPSAISSLFHSVIGSALAALWRRSAEPHAIPTKVLAETHTL